MRSLYYIIRNLLFVFFYILILYCKINHLGVHMEMLGSQLATAANNNLCKDSWFGFVGRWS